MYLYIYYIYVARIFSNIFRFIDRLCTFNKEVKENEDPCKASFLDLSIKVVIKNSQLSCLMKEMSFPFILIACPI